MKTLEVIFRVFLMSIIVLLACTAIMPNWFNDRDVIYEQLLHNYLSSAEISMREEAKRKGIPYKEYKQKVESARVARAQLASQNAKLITQLDAAIAINDLKAIVLAANKLSIGEIGPDRVLSSIKNEKVEIFKVLFKKSVLCSQTTIWSKVYQFEKDVYRAVIRAQNVEFLHVWYGMACDTDFKRNKDELLRRLAEDLVTLGKADKIFILAEFEDYLNLVTRVIWQSLIKDQEVSARTVFEDAFSTLDKNKSEVTFLNSKYDFFLRALYYRQVLFAESVLEHDPDYIRRNNLGLAAYQAVCRNQLIHIPKSKVDDFIRNSHALFSDKPPLCVREQGGFIKYPSKDRYKLYPHNVDTNELE